MRQKPDRSRWRWLWDCDGGGSINQSASRLFCRFIRKVFARKAFLEFVWILTILINKWNRTYSNGDKYKHRSKSDFMNDGCFSAVCISNHSYFVKNIYFQPHVFISMVYYILIVWRDHLYPYFYIYYYYMFFWFIQYTKPVGIRQWQGRFLSTAEQYVQKQS